MAVSGPWQIEWRSLLTGDGTDYDIAPPIEGLNDLPEIRVSDSPNGQFDGDYPGMDLLSARWVTVPYEIVGTDAADLEANLAAFNAVMLPSQVDYPLSFWLPGYTAGRRVNGRVRRRSAPISVDYELGRKTLVTVQWYCADPLIYADTESTTGSIIGGSTPTVDNDGTVPAPFVVRMTSGTLTSVEVGGLTIQANGTIGVGEWLEFDTRRGTVVDENGDSAWDRVEQWDTGIAIPVGSSTLTTANGSTVTTWRSAWA